MNKIFITMILLAGSVAQAEILSVHCPLGCPSSPASNDLVFGHLYAASNNPDTKFFDWVAYEVNVTNFGPSPARNWASDPLLDHSETLEEKDYKGASKALNIDRGHQAPLASFAGSRYWPEVNYLSNITPQAKDLNQGPWKDLEEAIRKASSFRNSVYVITGPLYERDMPVMPKADESHKVPSGYFKVAYQASGEAVAFIMDQETTRKADYCDKRVTLKQVETRTGLALSASLKAGEMGEKIGCFK
ncbi:DNA/RNA endonuclease [Oleiphilus sp. HI0081]|nr:DNA/RNA endonuclease [Oleiphilus sp. HI0078]KZZ20257.1 DNA/RNA endonuclease [Oleiphilus sp. HI0081]